MHYYKILGLTTTATAVELKKAYQVRAMELHPDRNIERDTTVEFQALQEAYAVLGDPDDRAKYDQLGGIPQFVMPEKKRMARPARKNLKTLLSYARRAFDGFGYFAQMQDVRNLDDRARGAVEMMEDINWIADQAARLSSPELYAAAASALSSYSVWYCYTYLGEDKIPPLALAVKMLAAALDLATDKTEFELRLAWLLIGRPQVRDLRRARELAERVTNPKYKRYVKEALQAINRFEGTPTLDLKFSYASMTFVPIGAFYGERTNCRAVMRKLKKDKNVEALRTVLDHLYRIAILGEAAGAIMIYGGDAQRSEHIKHLKRAIPAVKQMSYASHGLLKMCWQWKPILSDADYKVFEWVYGKTEKEFDPYSLLDFDVAERVRLGKVRAEAFVRSKEVDAQKALEATMNCALPDFLVAG